MWRANDADVDSAAHSRQAANMAGPVRLHKQTVAQQHQEEELASLWAFLAAGATAHATTLIKNVWQEGLLLLITGCRDPPADPDKGEASDGGGECHARGGTMHLHSLRLESE